MIALLLALQQPGLTIRLAADTTAPVHVAGTFNNWNPGDPAMRLRREGREHVITLPDSIRGPVEFKFTLGSWETVELTAEGGDAPNRMVRIPAAGPAEYRGTVPRWSDGRPRVRPHTLRPGVRVLDSAFAVPQLGVRRRVWLYLPPDYETSRRRYPVLYLHDGQNVFDNATSYAGEWGVDETLDSLHALGDSGIIVVAVDHGGPARIPEYAPWPNPRYGGGRGVSYVDFLALTLKPHIDAHYRTLPDAAHTGIGGSSMGGLISTYAGLKYPGVFGRVLAFSPAFWVNPEIMAFVRGADSAGTRPAAANAPAMRFYFLSGLEEGSGTLDFPPRVFARLQNAMVDSLLAAGVPRENIVSLLPADGVHSEWFWRREFPAAYRWLFRAGSNAR